MPQKAKGLDGSATSPPSPRLNVRRMTQITGSCFGLLNPATTARSESASSSRSTTISASASVDSGSRRFPAGSKLSSTSAMCQQNDVDIADQRRC